jgi:hypothetical protein
MLKVIKYKRFCEIPPARAGKGISSIEVDWAPIIETVEHYLELGTPRKV